MIARPHRWSSGLLLVLLVLAARQLGASSPSPDPTKTEPAAPAAKVVVAPIPDVRSFDGPQLYGALCADCHGERGAGDGRFAAKLGRVVPDLTRLAEEGSYDRAAIRRDIAKCSMVPSPEAESWGQVLVGSYGQARGQRMLDDLAGHLESLQAPPAR